MRGQGEQVLAHYCNETDIPALHQEGKKWQLKCPGRFLLQARGRGLSKSPSVVDNVRGVKRKGLILFIQSAALFLCALCL